MGKIIAVVNQKGGVGKTTSAVNIAAALGALGKKVLLVDIDPQGNSTSGLGINKRTLGSSSVDVLLGDGSAAVFPAEKATIKLDFDNLFLIPTGIDLAGAEIKLVDMPGRESRLRDSLARLRDRVDFILIDCPPSLGLLTLNGLVAADTLLIPIQCEYYALEGLSQLIATVRQVKRLYNPLLDIEGVLFTMYDSRLRLTAQVAQEVKKYFPKKVFRTAIPRSVRLSEAPSHGMPITIYDKGGKACEAYMDVARELVSRQ